MNPFTRQKATMIACILSGILTVLIIIYITWSYIQFGASIGFFMWHDVGHGWLVTECEACQQSPLDEGDTLVQIGDVTYTDWLQHNRSFPIPSEGKSLVLITGTGKMIDWHIPKEVALPKTIIVLFLLLVSIDFAVTYAVWRLRPNPQGILWSLIWIVLMINYITLSLKAAVIAHGYMYQLFIIFNWLHFSLLCMLMYLILLRTTRMKRRDWLTSLVFVSAATLLGAASSWMPLIMDRGMFLFILVLFLMMRLRNKSISSSATLLIIWGLLLSLIPMIVYDILLQMGYHFTWTLALFLESSLKIYPLFIAYALFRHKLDDSRITQSIYRWALSALSFVFVLVFLSALLVQTVAPSIAPREALVIVIISIGSILLATIVWGRASNFFNIIVYGDMNNSHDAVANMVEHLPDAIRSGDLVSLIDQTSELLSIKTTELHLLPMHDREIYRLIYAQNDDQQSSISFNMEPLERKGLELILPLRTANGIVLGYWMVGQKQYGRIYTPWERAELRNIAQHIASAIEVYYLNRALQYELEENERLAESNIRQSKLSMVGQVTAWVAHEIMTPLQVIVTELAMLKAMNPPEGGEHSLSVMKKQVNYITAVIRSAGNFVRPSSDKVSKINVSDVLNDALILTRDRLKQTGTDAVVSLDNVDTSVYFSRSQLTQVFTTLIVNACDAMGEQENKKNTLHIIGYTVGSELIIRVKDSGSGIVGGSEEQIFDKFYTTKERGMGLGLAVAHQIMTQAGGDLRLVQSSNPTIFEIVISTTQNSSEKQEPGSVMEGLAYETVSH